MWINQSAASRARTHKSMRTRVGEGNAESGQAAVNAGQRNTEDGAVDLHGVRQGIGPEQYPGKAGETEGDKDPEHFVSLLFSSEM